MKSYWLIILILLLMVQCGTRDTRSKFEEEEFYVLADTNNLGKIHGPAEYYSNDNRLMKRIYYKDGVRDGPSVNYYESGIVRDSVVYANGKKVNFWYFFDSTGELSSREKYFFDKRLGPEEYYGKNGNIRFYYFSNFESRDIVFAKYDPQGKLYENDFFRLQFVAATSAYNKKMLNVFSYLPRLPACDVKYHIGMSRNGKEMQKLFEVKNDLFIDTLLPKLDLGWTYYISCDIEQPSSKFKRVYIEEYGKRPNDEKK